MPSQRSKRLRKKLYLDEFAVLGFVISLKLKTNSDEELDTFIASLASLSDVRTLLISGGGIKCIELVVGSALRYGSATEQDREALKDWIQQQNEVELIEIGPLVDMNQLDLY